MKVMKANYRPTAHLIQVEYIQFIYRKKSTDEKYKMEKSFEKIIGYYCILLAVIVRLFLFAKSWEWVVDFNLPIVCHLECTECWWCSGNVNIMLIVWWGLNWIRLVVTCPWAVWKAPNLRWGLIICFKWQSKVQFDKITRKLYRIYKAGLFEHAF